MMKGYGDMARTKVLLPTDKLTKSLQTSTFFEILAKIHFQEIKKKITSHRTAPHHDLALCDIWAQSDELLRRYGPYKTSKWGRRTDRQTDD